MAGEQSIAELILRILADSSQVKKELEEASAASEKFAKETGTTAAQADSVLGSLMKAQEEKAKKTTSSFEKFTSGMRQVSRSAMQMGAMLMGPVVAALAVGAKMSGQVEVSMVKLGEATKLFSLSVAQAALPVVEKFTQWLVRLNQWFLSLPVGVRQSIVQFALLGGAFLIVAGMVARVIYIFGILGPKLAWIGGIFKWLAGIVVGAAAAIGWPLTILIGVVALFATAWTANWLGVRDFTQSVLGVIGNSIDWLYDRLMRIVLTLQNKAGGMSWAQAWKEAGDAVTEARKKCDEEGLGMEDRLKNLGTSAAETVDKMKAKLGELGSKLGSVLGGAGVPGDEKGQKNIGQELLSGVQLGLKKTYDAFGNFSEQMKTLTSNLVQGMASMFSTMFFDLLMGEFKSFEEYMAEFGRKILNMILEIIMQLIIAYWIKKALTAMGWGGLFSHEGRAIDHYHVGGFVKKAHDGLAPGEVPIVAQQGEGILSRNGMATLGSVENLNKLNAGESVGGGLNVNLVQVIRAWGPEDVYRERKALSGAMIEELERNGLFRAAIKKYK